MNKGEEIHYEHERGHSISILHARSPFFFFVCVCVFVCVLFFFLLLLLLFTPYCGFSECKCQQVVYMCILKRGERVFTA